MQAFLIVVLFALTMIGCSQPNLEHENKMDAPLKQKLSAMESESNKETIKIFGKCTEDINDKMKQALEDSGIQVESTVGSIFTASGTSEQIRKASSLEYVTQLSLSTKSQLLK